MRRPERMPVAHRMHIGFACTRREDLQTKVYVVHEHSAAAEAESDDGEEKPEDGGEPEPMHTSQRTQPTTTARTFDTFNLWQLYQKHQQGSEVSVEKQKQSQNQKTDQPNIDAWTVVGSVVDISIATSALSLMRGTRPRQLCRLPSIMEPAALRSCPLRMNALCACCTMSCAQESDDEAIRSESPRTSHRRKLAAVPDCMAGRQEYPRVPAVPGVTLQHRSAACNNQFCMMRQQACNFA
jgi:hypothetical protein